MNSMYRGFLTGDSASGQVFLEAILKDARNASLSPQFRIYYRLRPLIPLSVRQFLQGHLRIASNGTWYLPTEFVRALDQSLTGNCEALPIIHPWPDAARFCFVLTHDVETADGLHHVSRIAQIEEELGLRSSWSIVPYKYGVDPGLVNDLKSRGFEIGIHGYNHDGRLYTSKRVFDKRVPAINEALRKFGAVGFRSPMVHRNLEWLQSLEIEYDASCFDVDPFQAMPGGVGSIWPFVCGKFVELPYTLPQDHTLFITLGQQDCRIWDRKLEFVVRNSGMAVVLTHPEYLTSRDHLDLYRDFLIRVRDRGGYWHALPKQVAAWWSKRSRSKLSVDDRGQWYVHGPAAPRGKPATVDFDHQTQAIRELCPTGTLANCPTTPLGSSADGG
jgi:peptidoglycan/xylan/chitin deacetylase (PgdA/CDA1 family)